MRVGKNSVTGEGEIYLEPDESEMMKEMVRGACLPHRQHFNKILEEL